MPINEEQYIDVIPEDPKVSASMTTNSTSKNSHTNTYIDMNDLDDLMFDMTAPNNTKPAHVKK